MIKPINHYSIENPATVYDEEAVTALQLAGRTAAKVNEVINDQNSLRSETEETVNRQNNNIDNLREDYNEFTEKVTTEIIPAAVETEFQEKINDGTLNGMISEYAGGLSNRLDNLVGSLPEGSTTADAELIDIRTDKDGFLHAAAGEAVRDQVNKVNHKLDEITAGQAGLYKIPVTWRFNEYRFTSSVFKIPRGGFSVRMPFVETKLNGGDAVFCHRVDLGVMINGTFVKDDEKTEEYCNTSYSRRFYYVPYIEGYYAIVQYTPIGNAEKLLNADNYTQFAHLTDDIKIYSGSIYNGGNILGCRPVNIRTDAANPEKYIWQWGITGLIHKYQFMSTPLPLKYVNKVCCSPDMWLGGKVYKFDPITRTHEYVETLCWSTQHPVFGYECCLDFSQYGDNYYCLLIFGKVPTKGDYDAEHFDYKDAVGTKNVTVFGFDMTDIEKKIYVDWSKDFQFTRELSGGSLTVQKNINLLKNLRHKTVSAYYPRGTSDYHYIFGMDNFAGVLYGGGYQAGTFYYHVSPATYYTALLNPNSNAYKNEDLGSATYGIVCSPFTCLLHGYDIPRSTFDMRYNMRMRGLTPEKFNLEKQLHTVKRYDVLTWGSGHTGHSLLIGDITNIENECSAIRVLESTTPATTDGVWWLNNGMPYYKAEPEAWYQNAYDFICRVDPAFDQTIYNRANWVPKYTTPQKVMCNRGYESVYLTSTPVYLSVAPDVTEIQIYIDDEPTATRVIEDLEPVTRNGYNLVNISDVVRAGKIRVRNNVDDSEETFYVFDDSGYTVSATIEGDWLTVHTNKPDEVKYVNFVVSADPDTYTATDGANICLDPEFDATGNMRVNTRFITQEIGTWALSERNNPLDSVNIIFKTPYDTNTFCKDAEGDTIL